MRTQSIKWIIIVLLTSIVPARAAETYMELTQGCDKADTYTALSVDNIKHHLIIPKDKMLNTGGSMHCAIREDRATPGQFYRTDFETGLINGHKYMIYKTDGSGELQSRSDDQRDILASYGDNWSFQCIVDQIND